jgi:hypothetical protein
VESGVQRGGFDSVVAVARPLDGDRVEDRRIGTFAGWIDRASAH